MSTDLSARTVYIVEDDVSVRRSLLKLFHSYQIEVKDFASAESFLENIETIKGGCLLLDLRLTGMSGLDLQQELLVRGHEIPIVFMTGHGDEASRTRAMSQGAIRFMEKPCDPEELVEVVQQAFGG